MGDAYPCGFFDSGGSFPQMSTLDRNKLKALLEQQGLTPRALSREIGDNPYLVRDILVGKSKNPRADTVARMATRLGVSVQELLMDGSAPSGGDPRIAPRFLPVRYKVQAGLWFEIDAEEPPVQVSHAVHPDPRFAQWPQWLELVVGDSVNLKIPPGHYAHVVDAVEMGYAPTDGNWVVVERRRGAIRERTIKQIAVTEDGEVQLWPRSTNPKWSAPLQLKQGAEGEDVEVAIVGLVIGAYDPEF